MTVEHSVVSLRSHGISCPYSSEYIRVLLAVSIRTCFRNLWSHKSPPVYHELGWLPEKIMSYYVMYVICIVQTTFQANSPANDALAPDTSTDLISIGGIRDITLKNVRQNISGSEVQLFDTKGIRLLP